MKKQLMERIHEVDKKILEIIGEGRTIDDLEHLRLETGMDYLVKKYGHARARRMWASKGFWAWWRIIWHLNNADIIDFLSVEEGTTISWDDYAEGQLAKSIHKYNLSTKEMNELVIPGPPDDEAELETTNA